MEDGFNKNDNNDQIVQETVLSTRKGKKVRKVIGQIVLTIVLACIFGAVAAVVFVKTDSALLKRFGLKVAAEQGPEKSRVVLDKGDDGDSVDAVGTATKKSAPSQTVTTEPAEKQEPAPQITPDSVDYPKPVDQNADKAGKNGKNADGTENETGADSKDITKSGTQGQTDDPDQTATPADLAKAAEHYMFCVTGSTKNMNWLDEQITTSASYPGIFLADNGVELLILVNYSDFLEYENLSVTIRNDRTYEAKPYAFDKDFDMLILAVQKSDVDEGDLEFIEPAAIANSAVPQAGTPIVALGSPNGYFGSMLTGYVSSSGSIFPIMDGTVTLFNTDIVDNSFGRGVILAYDGELLGFISQKMRAGLDEYMNTCIWANGAKLVLEHLLNDQPLASIGVMVKDMPANVLAEMEIENGIYITEVVAGTPAEEAGLRRGTVIRSMNDVNIENVAQFDRILWRYDEGHEVKALIYNPVKKEDQELSFVVGKR